MEAKKASEIIIDLDNKINAVLSILNSHDMIIKNISNKLNEIKKLLETPQAPKYTMEAVDPPPKNIVISAEVSLPEEKFPKPNRRVTRPDLVADIKVAKPTEDVAEIVVNLPDTSVPVMDSPVNLNQNLIPVYQRVINTQGKSQFMADVEVLDASLASIFKGRTNGVGKWQASLPVGKYKVNIRKIDALTKNRLESSEVVIVDGTKSPLELGSVTLK